MRGDEFYSITLICSILRRFDLVLFRRRNRFYVFFFLSPLLFLYSTKFANFFAFFFSICQKVKVKYNQIMCLSVCGGAPEIAVASECLTHRVTKPRAFLRPYGEICNTCNLFFLFLVSFYSIPLTVKYLSYNICFIQLVFV